MIKITNHSKLNPKLWKNENSLRPDVESLLKNIMVSIVSSLSTLANIPIDLDKDVADFLVCGSCAGYNYKRKSDLDFKIIINPERYLEKMDWQTFIVFSKFVTNSFIERYSPKIRGISVDVGINFKRYERSWYSLKTHKWIVNPVKLNKEEIKYINYRANLYYMAIKKKVNLVINNKLKHKDAAELYLYLKDKRVKSWDEEFSNNSPFAIAFSKLLSHTKIRKRLLDTDEDYTRKMMTDVNVDPS